MKALLTLASLAVALGALAQEPPEPVAPASAEAPRFQLGGDFKLGFRDSRAEESRVFFPFPPSFLPPGETQVFMRTPLPGRSLEPQYLSLVGQGEVTSGVIAKFEVRFLDLYNRNPTSSDDRVFLRQAFVRFGTKVEPLDSARGSNLYVQIGVAPRFTKQVVRHLESYGLWGTAVGRFEQPQVELGVRLGQHAYLRGMAGNGNPLFMRDTNALAGDNGTPERQPGNVHPIYQSGFPILYDAKPTDLNFSGEFEWGAGVGARFGGGDKKGLDTVAWYFTRRLADSVRLRGTTYSGDLKLLRGNGFSLPFAGDTKREWGVNVQAQAGGFRFFGQYVDQDIAGLKRRGYEADVAWKFDLPGLFLVKESPFGNWIQPAFRYSSIDNLFTGPLQYPALSVLWEWKKYDFGLRFGLVRNVDLTAEYTLHEVHRTATLPNLPMNELLITLRVGFDLF